MRAGKHEGWTEGRTERATARQGQREAEQARNTARASETDEDMHGKMSPGTGKRREHGEIN